MVNNVNNIYRDIWHAISQVTEIWTNESTKQEMLPHTLPILDMPQWPTDTRYSNLFLILRQACDWYLWPCVCQLLHGCHGVEHTVKTILLRRKMLKMLPINFYSINRGKCVTNLQSIIYKIKVKIIQIEIVFRGYSFCVPLKYVLFSGILCVNNWTSLIFGKTYRLCL